MIAPTLYIGDRAYSSWSLRASLAVRKSGAEFEERVIHLDQPETKAALAAISPSMTVPVLHVEDDIIWDSLAISEWAAENTISVHLWPPHPRRRALARACASTMHSGFAALRAEAPMNLHRRATPTELSRAALKDVEALRVLWSFVRRAGVGDGPFLLGEWSIADAMATPYATRLRSYAITTDDEVEAYIGALFADPHFLAWENLALADPRRLEHVDSL